MRPQFASRLFQQLDAGLKISACNKSVKNNLRQACWINNAVASCSNKLAKSCHQQACYKLFQQLDAGLIISTCNKSVLTTCNSIVDSTSLSQVVLTDLSRLVIHRLAASCFNKSANDRLQLDEINKLVATCWQVATSR